jgi:uncharacterized protein
MENTSTLSCRNPISWFEIYVDDMPRAKAFYQTVLALELTAIGSPDILMYGFPVNRDVYGACGALVHVPGFAAGGNSTLVYFNVDDCAVEEARVNAAGGTIQRPKMSIGEHGFISLCFDTEGNLFGLHSTS